jgi:hypothetical protein
MSYPIIPGFSRLGILAPMDPTTTTNPIHPNSYIGPLVTSDWNAPVEDIGRNIRVTSAGMNGVPEAMKALDMVNFLFPV